MQNQPSSPQLTTDRALLVCRILWAALLLGQVLFLAVIMVIWTTNPSFTAQPDTARLLFYAALGMLVGVVPMGYFVRGQVYKNNWQGNAVTPNGYLTGNLVLLAMCEGVSLLGLVATLLNGSLWPTVLPSVLAMAVQALNFPNGLAMQPAFPSTTANKTR